MEQRHIDRIRNMRFTMTRRGYEQREVDNFMLELAEWLESRAAEEIGSFAVKRKLEMVGRTTANVLTTAEQEAEELRQTAEREAAEVTQRADAAARSTREAAEDFAGQARENAKRQAEEKVAAASEEARAKVEEGEHRRAAIEAEITELEGLRDRVLADLERLGTEIDAAFDAHRRQPTPDLAGALSPKDGAQRTAPTRQRKRPTPAPTPER